MVSPIKFTKSRLSYTVDEYNEAGLFVGDPNNYLDLINFWNVRASGRSVSFFPFGDTKRIKKYVKSKIDRLSKVLKKHDNYEEPIHIYHTSVDFESCKKIAGLFKTKKPFGYYNVEISFGTKSISKPQCRDLTTKLLLQ